MYFSITVCPSTWHFWRWLSSSCGIFEFLGGCHVLFNYCSMFDGVYCYHSWTANWNPIRPLEVTHCTLSSDIPRKRPRNNLGGGNSKIFLFSPLPTWGDDPIWRAYSSKGLVQPPTSNDWKSHFLLAWPNFKCYNLTFRECNSQVSTVFPLSLSTRKRSFPKRGSRWQVKTSVFQRWGLLSKCHWQRTEWSYHGDLDFIEQTNQPSLHRNGGKSPNILGSKESKWVQMFSNASKITYT